MSFKTIIEEATKKHSDLVEAQNKEFKIFEERINKEFNEKVKFFIDNETKSAEEMAKTIDDALDEADRLARKEIEGKK